MASWESWKQNNLSATQAKITGTGSNRKVTRKSSWDIWKEANDPVKKQQADRLKEKYERPWEYTSRVAELETPDSFYADWASADYDWDDTADDTTKGNTLADWQTQLHGWERTNSNWKKYLDAARADVEYYQGLYNYKQNESNWNDYQKAKAAYESAVTDYEESFGAYQKAADIYSSRYEEVHPEVKWAQSIGDYDEDGAYRVKASAEEIRGKAESTKNSEEADFYYQVYLGTLDFGDAAAIQAERDRLTAQLSGVEKSLPRGGVRDVAYARKAMEDAGESTTNRASQSIQNRLKLLDSYEQSYKDNQLLADTGITNWQEAEQYVEGRDKEIEALRDQIIKANRQGSSERTAHNEDIEAQILALEQERNLVARYYEGQRGQEIYDNSSSTVQSALKKASEIYRAGKNEEGLGKYGKEIRTAVQDVADAMGTDYDTALRNVQAYDFYANEAAGARYRQEGEDRISDSNAFLASLGVVINNMWNGIPSTFNYLRQKNRDRYVVDINDESQRSRIVNDAVQSAIAEDIRYATYGKNLPDWLGGQNVGETAYQIGMSTAESALRMGIALVGGWAVTGAAGLAAGGLSEAAAQTTTTLARAAISDLLMGNEVAAREMTTMIQDGYSADTAVTVGIIRGAVEGITEAVSVEKFLDALDSGPAWKSLLKSFLAESEEEWEANVLNRLVDKALLAGEGGILSQYNTFLADNPNATADEKKEALTKALISIGGEDLSAALAGGISGLLMSGVGVGVSTNKATVVTRAAMKNIIVQQLNQSGTNPNQSLAADTVAAWDNARGNVYVTARGNKFEATVVDGVTGEAHIEEYKTRDKAIAGAAELAMDYLGGKNAVKQTVRGKNAAAADAWLAQNSETSTVAATNPGRMVETQLSKDIQTVTATDVKLDSFDAIKAANVLSNIVSGSTIAAEDEAVTGKTLDTLTEYLHLKDSAAMRQLFEAQTGVKVEQGKEHDAVQQAIKGGYRKAAAARVERLNREREEKKRVERQAAWNKSREAFVKTYTENQKEAEQLLNEEIKKAEQAGMPAVSDETNAVDVMGTGDYMTFDEFKQSEFYRTVAESTNRDGVALGEEGARLFFNTMLAEEQGKGTAVRKENGKVTSQKGAFLEDLTMNDLDVQQKATYAILDALCKKLGITMQLYKGVGSLDRGSYDPKTGIIRIDINAGTDGRQTMLFTASHELTHLMRQYAGEKFVNLARMLTESYGTDTVNKRIQKLQAARKTLREGIEKNKDYDDAEKARLLEAYPELSWNVAYEEVVANAMESMLTSKGAMDMILEMDKEVKGIKGVFVKFANKVNRALETLYASFKPDTYDGQFVYEMMQAKPEVFDELRKAYVEGIKEAGKNQQDGKEQAADLSGVKKELTGEGGTYAEQNAEPGSASENVKRYSINLATIDYALKYIEMSEKEMQQLSTIYNACTELANIQTAMGKINKGVFNSETGRTAKNIHEINDYLGMHPDVHQRLIDIQNKTKELGITCDFVSGIGEEVFVEGKKVAPGVKGLPIEYVESTTGKRVKFTAFWRTLPQMYLDAIGLQGRELRGLMVKAVEDAYTRKTGITDLLPEFNAQFPGTATPTEKEIKAVAGDQSRKNIAGKTMNKVQSPLRSAEKTVMALNLNSACPMFTVGNHGCYLDACYLTQMANGATGTNLFRSAWYTGEILQLSDETIATMNRLGGMRLNGVGDTTADNKIQLMDVLRHAAMRGLKVKVITKQRATLEVLADAYNAGINISNVDVQLSMDNLWLPAELDDVYGAGVRGTIGLAETVRRGRMRSAAVGYDTIFGRATQVVDGVMYRKYGFSAEQIEDMHNEFSFVHITPRYVVCTAPEMAEIALNRDGDIVNHGNVIQTLMHGKVPAACIIDAKYAQTDGKPTPIINFGGLRHKIVKNAETGEWDFYGVTVKEVKQDVTINGETISTKKTVEKKAPAAKQKPYNIVKQYVQEHYTPEEQETIWTNLRNQMCCQTNDYHDACAGCQSLCARGYSCNAHQDFDSTQYSEEEKLDAMSAYTGDSPYAMQDGNATDEETVRHQTLATPEESPAAENVDTEYLEENGFDPGIRHSMAIQSEGVLSQLEAIDALGPYDPVSNPGGYIETYKSMSFWGFDENGAAMLRSPMAEDSGLVYLIPADGTHNWYQTTIRSEEDVKKKLIVNIVTRPIQYLPLVGNEQYINKNRSNIYAKVVSTTKAGKEKVRYVKVSEDYDGPEELIVKRDRATAYVPYIGNEHLVKDDYSNLYYNLNRKNSVTGESEGCPARYNPYEHSSNSMLNDQFDGAYKRPNLVTVKMRVPVGGTLDGTPYKAKYAKDGTGWTPWKSGKVANMISAEKDFRRDLFLSMYAAPIEIIPDSEVAQYYKDLMAGTSAVVPSNVVSPSLLAELRKIGVPIKEVSEVAQWEKETADMPKIEYRREDDPRYESDEIRHQPSIRDVVSPKQSQVYNWAIKKGLPLSDDGHAPDGRTPIPASSGSQSEVLTSDNIITPAPSESQEENTEEPIRRQMATSFYEDFNKLDPEARKVVTAARQRAMYSDAVATMTGERFDAASKELNYGEGQFSSTGRGYYVFIDPFDFLSLTTSGTVQSFLDANPNTLNAGVSADWGTPNNIQESGPMFLRVEEDDSGAWKVIGHEGRHRMAALYRAGLDHVAIMVRTAETADMKPIRIARVSPQFRSSGDTYLHNLIPGSADYNNIARTIFAEGHKKVMSDDNSIRYQSAALFEETSDITLAETARINYNNLIEVITNDKSGRYDQRAYDEYTLERLKKIYASGRVDRAGDRNLLCDALRRASALRARRITEDPDDPMQAETVDPRFYTNEMLLSAKRNKAFGFDTEFFVGDITYLSDGAPRGVIGIADTDEKTAYSMITTKVNSDKPVLTNSLRPRTLASYHGLNPVSFLQRHERLHLLLAIDEGVAGRAAKRLLWFVGDEKSPYVKYFDQINTWYQINLRQEGYRFDDYSQEIACDLYSSALTLEDPDVRRQVRKLISAIDNSVDGDIRYQTVESNETGAATETAPDIDLYTSPAFRSFAEQYDTAHGEGAMQDLILRAGQLKREIERIREKAQNGVDGVDVAELIKQQENEILAAAQSAARAEAQRRVMAAFKPTNAAEARRVEQLKSYLRTNEAVDRQKTADEQKLQRNTAWQRAAASRDLNREKVRSGFREQEIRQAADEKLNRTVEEMRADKLAAVAKERLKAEDRLARMAARKDAKIVSAKIKGKFELDRQRRLLSDEAKEAIRAKRKRLNLEPRETENDEVEIDWGVTEKPARFSKEWVQQKKEIINKFGSELYRWFVNELRAIENFDSVQARNGVQGTTAGVLAKAAGVSGGRAQYIYTKGLRSKSGEVIGEAFKDVFYFYNEDGTIDEAKTDLLRQYMTYLHTVDRMSFKKHAEEVLTTFEDAHPDIAGMAADRLALIVTDEYLAERSNDATDMAEEVEEYRLAQAYVFLMQQRINAKDKPVIADKNGKAVSAETAQKLADEMLAKYDWLAEKANGIYDWWDKFMREYAVGSSVSETEYETLRQMYPHYIPTYRVQEGTDNRIQQVGEMLITRKAVGKATGSTKQLITADDCFANSIARILKLNAANELYQNIYETAQNDTDGKMSDWVQIDPDDVAVSASGDFADMDAADSLTEVDGMCKVGVWFSGEKHTVLVNKDLYRALNDLTNKQTSDWVRGITKAGQKLSAPMKAMITGYNPLFGARNVARDFPTAVINSISGMSFPKYYAQAMKEIRKSENWENFEALGGTQMGYFRNESGRNGNTMAFMRAMNKKTGAAGVAETALDKLGWFNETTESVTRFAEYLATIDKLGNTYEGRLVGIKNAAEVTVDFSRRGSAGTLINAWIPYWNPAVQGIDKVFRSVFDTHDVRQSLATLGRAAATAVMGEALMQAILAALGKRKDWEELSDYVKDNYYCIPTADHKFLKIPKNREWASVIGTPISRIIQYVDGRSDPFEQYFDINIKGNFLPSGIEDAIGLGTIWDLKNNENYAGQAIVGSEFKDATSGAYAANKNIWNSETSLLAYGLSKVLLNSLSPVQVDYIISDYCGDFVSTFVGLFDMGLVSGDNTLGESLVNIGNNFTKSLIADNRYSSQIQSDYYGALDDLAAQVQDAKLADPENYQNGLAYKTRQGMLQYGKQISEINKQLRGMVDGEEKNAMKEQVLRIQAEALDLYERAMSGEISEPLLYAKYDNYGESIRDELISINTYAKDYGYEPTYAVSGRYSDPEKKGYEYILTDDQKAYLEQLFDEAYTAKVGAAIKTSKYGNASPERKAEILELARSEALELAKTQFFQWIKTQTKSTKKSK